MLATQSAEACVSHLFVSEAYYFNPTQVKRSQLVRLITLVQDNLGKPKQRKNFFERKRLA